MAKTVSPIFKFQGTIEDLTFVNSRRYKPHVRARKNSKTPFVMTAALAESKARIQACNQYAKPVFQALRAEVHDGGLWSRLVSRLFAELKAGRPLGLECLKGFECNLQHPLSEVINSAYDFSATVSQNQLGIYVQLDKHPKVEDEMPRTGYQLRFVGIFPDAVNGTVKKVEVLGPLTKYKDELVAHDLKMELPGNGTPYILLMGIVPHLQGEGAAKIMSDSGMKVVWVGSQAASYELRAASGIQEGMERQAADERQATSGELEEKQAASYELRAASVRQPEVMQDTSANGVVEMGALRADAAAAGERLAMSDKLPSGRDKLRAKSGRKNVCAACQSHPLAVAKNAWDGGAKIVSESTKKGPEPLLKDKAGNWTQGLTPITGHEDAAPILPLKSRLPGRANNEDNALFNPDSNRDQGASSGSYEIILHNKTAEKILTPILESPITARIFSIDG